MKLQDQVTNLELSRKLKKLGVKQESVWYWQVYRDGDIFLLSSKDVEGFVGRDAFCDYYSAYTCSELGEMLPHFIRIKKIKYQLFESVALGEMNNPSSKKQWFIVYANEEDYHDNAPIKFMMCYSEANARAKMLIYLLENGLTKN